MIVFRIIGLLLFGLLVALVITDLVKGPTSNLGSDMIALLIFALFILVLGPFWPSAPNIQRWHKDSKFRLPTDKEEVALYVIHFLVSTFSLYRAWDQYANRAIPTWRIEKRIHAAFGTEGVVAFWLVVGIASLLTGLWVRRKAIQSKSRAG